MIKIVLLFCKEIANVATVTIASSVLKDQYRCVYLMLILVFYTQDATHLLAFSLACSERESFFGIIPIQV